MLPPTHRLTSPAEFREAVRRGARSGGPLLVLHLLRPQPAGLVARAGFVVSKGVGGAVTRNRVKRRLRQLVGDRLVRLPVGSLLVVRAQPAAAGADYSELAAELERCLERCLERIDGLGVPA